MRDLVRGLMVGSGNDAAIAIAYAVSGSEGEFVQRMNERAAEMGLTRTRFANPHGLDEPGHESSPRDLAVLGREVMKVPLLQSLVGDRVVTLPGPGGEGSRRLQSQNDLLAIMPSADGIKTGHTDAAGYCLVTSAEREGMRLISVVLGTMGALALERFRFRGRQVFDALLQLLLTGVLSRIHLLAAAVHHLGVSQRPGLDRFWHQSASTS